MSIGHGSAMAWRVVWESSRGVIPPSLSRPSPVSWVLRSEGGRMHTRSAHSPDEPHCSPRASLLRCRPTSHLSALPLQLGVQQKAM